MAKLISFPAQTIAVMLWYVIYVSLYAPIFPSQQWTASVIYNASVTNDTLNQADYYLSETKSASEFLVSYCFITM